MDGSAPGEPETRNGGSGETEEKTEKAMTFDQRPRSAEDPDVYLDVPQLKVEEISLEVDDLEAHVALVAQVLDLLKLNVGADVLLGRVKLEIEGVEAQAQLKVRLDNVAAILDRVLTTLDRNPEILHHIGRGMGHAVGDIGAGTGEAVSELGRGAGGAVQDVGRGAGGAVQGVGQGAGGAVQGVGQGAGGAVQDVGRGAGGAVQGVGGAAEGAEGAGERPDDTSRERPGDAVEEAGAAEERPADTDERPDDTSDRAGRAEEDTGEQDGGAPEEDTEGGAEGGSADRADEGGPEAEDGQGQDATPLQSALRDTEESVRDLGRALSRLISQARSGGERP